MTDQTIMAIVLTAFSAMIICWAWYLYAIRQKEIKTIAKPKRFKSIFPLEGPIPGVPVKKSKPRTQVKKTTTRKKTMPLKKSTSKEAFKSNVKTELAAGKKPSQAVAIAYSEKREAAKKTTTKGKK